MTHVKAARVLDGLRSGHLRWPILLLLFLSTVINYRDRQVFSVLAPHIKGDLGMTISHYALIINAFNIGTVLGLFISGPLIDKIVARIGSAVSILIWSMAGGLTSLANGVTTFAVFRFLLGLGESGNWPAASKAVAEWFPAKERALAMRFFNGGVSIGAILAPLLVPALFALFGGWRWAFVTTAWLGVPWVYHWRKIYYPSNAHPRITREEPDLINKDRIEEDVLGDFSGPGDQQPGLVLHHLLGVRLPRRPVRVQPGADRCCCLDPLGDCGHRKAFKDDRVQLHGNHHAGNNAVGPDGWVYVGVSKMPECYIQYTRDHVTDLRLMTVRIAKETP